MSEEPTEEKTPLQKCIAEQVAAGKTEAEAEELCKAKLAELAGAQEEETLESLKEQLIKIQTKLQLLEQREDEEVTAERTMLWAQQRGIEEKIAKLTAGDQEEVEPTPLEKCVAEQVAQGKTKEEAEEWCKEELAGEHEAADALIARSKQLIAMREHAAIEQRRRDRRHPV